jgi:cobalt-precorrin 5A hydrolase / cobalt-factor III methyltransferase / precorrin-3B C17-methyltransferase
VIGVVAVTNAGRQAARTLTTQWPDARAYEGPAAETLPRAFEECDAIVCFLAVGATVRLIAPLLHDKQQDPGIVCVDEALRHAVPVLGAHAGGANDLARRVHETLGAEPVITTASDAAGSVALDDFGADLGFRIEPGSDLAAVGAAILSGERVTLTADAQWPLPPLPPNVVRTEQPAPAGPAIIVTDRAGDKDIYPERAVVYRPPSLIVGMGASRGVPALEAGQLIDETLADLGVSPLSVRYIATADVKSDEQGLQAAAAERGWHIVTYPADRLSAVPVPNPSEVVRRAVGTPSVAEAAALATPPATLPPATRNPTLPDPTLPAATSPATLPHPPLPAANPDATLIATKRSSAHATIAVARCRPRGRLALIGIGPGARDLMTPRAVAELRRAAVVVGLDSYLEQIADVLRPGTTVLASGLGAEQERAATAVAQAQAGRAVALIGSGDAGVYAMASPALELAGRDIDVTVVPGITAALAAAAVLGAPLAHDHVMISLSDLHTAWPVIERRIAAAADGDLVTCFYNPASAKRSWQLRRALDLLSACRPPGTPVGWVRDATRPGQAASLTTLRDFDPAQADMHTLVVVGSSRTRIQAGRMVTPRDYRWALEPQDNVSEVVP